MDTPASHGGSGEHGEGTRLMAGAGLLQNTDSARQSLAGSEVEFAREILIKKKQPKPGLCNPPLNKEALQLCLSSRIWTGGNGEAANGLRKRWFLPIRH